MRHLAWAAATVAAFLLGLYFGGSARMAGFELLPPAAVATAPAAAGSAAAGGPEQPPGRDSQRAFLAGFGAGSHQVLADGRWQAALDELDQRARRGAETGALQRELLAAVREVARRGESATAHAMLDAYLQRNAHDPEAYLLDSDLLQMTGRTRQALSPLLVLLGFADDPAVVEQARDRLRLLINVQEAQLANTGDFGALVRLFEDLTLRDASFDGHRLRLAHWQLRAGRVAAAERTLAETGAVGVDPGAREDLEARLRLARSSLPLEQRDGALHVTAHIAGTPLRLLVDTGASTTALTRDGAVGLGAVPTGQRVRVRTANGIVDSEVHRVTEVEIGSLRLESLTVLVLEGPLPQGVDGLLGMDVLSRFPGVPGTSVAGAEAP